MDDKLLEKNSYIDREIDTNKSLVSSREGTGVPVQPQLSAQAPAKKFSIDDFNSQYQKKQGFKLDSTEGIRDNYGDLLGEGSKYDDEISLQSIATGETTANQERGEAQYGLTKLGLGVLKAGGLAGTTFLDGTAGTAIGLLNIGVKLSEGNVNNFTDVADAFISNPFSEAMQEFSDGMENVLPTYKTKEDEEAAWYNSFGSAAFWSDTVIKNVGFTIGAAYSGSLYAKGLSSALRVNKGRNILKGLSTMEGEAQLGAAQAINAINNGTATIGSEKVMENVLRAAKNIKTKDTAVKMGASVASSIGEGRIEAISNTNEWLRETYANNEEWKKATREQAVRDFKGTPEGMQMTQMNRFPDGTGFSFDLTEEGEAMVDASLVSKFKMADDYIEERAKVMRTQIMGLNMAVLGVGGYYQMGKLFLGGKQATKPVGTMIKESIDGGTKWTAKQAGKKAISKSAILGGLSEAAEEMNQAASGDAAGKYASAMMNSYLGAGFDPEALEEHTSFFSSLGDAFKETYGDIDNYDEAFAGFFTGIVGFPMMGSKIRKDGTKGVGVSWAGGGYNSYKEIRDQNKKDDGVAGMLNYFEEDNNGKKLVKSAIVNSSMDNKMNKALQENDVFSFENAEYGSFFNMVNTFNSVGRLETLLDNIDMFTQISEEDASRLRAEMLDKKTGKSIYEGMSDAEVVTAVQDNAKKVYDKAKLIADTTESIKGLFGDRLGEEAVSQFAWMVGQMDNWNDRLKDDREGINTLLNKIVASDTFKLRVGAGENYREVTDASQLNDVEAYNLLSSPYFVENYNKNLNKIHSEIGMDDPKKLAEFRNQIEQFHTVMNAKLELTSMYSALLDKPELMQDVISNLVTSSEQYVENKQRKEMVENADKAINYKAFREQYADKSEQAIQDTINEVPSKMVKARLQNLLEISKAASELEKLFPQYKPTGNREVDKDHQRILKEISDDLANSSENVDVYLAGSYGMEALNSYQYADGKELTNAEVNNLAGIVMSALELVAKDYAENKRLKELGENLKNEIDGVEGVTVEGTQELDFSSTQQYVGADISQFSEEAFENSVADAPTTDSLNEGIESKFSFSNPLGNVGYIQTSVQEFTFGSFSKGATPTRLDANSKYKAISDFMKPAQAYLGKGSVKPLDKIEFGVVPSINSSDAVLENTVVMIHNGNIIGILKQENTGKSAYMNIKEAVMEGYKSNEANSSLPMYTHPNLSTTVKLVSSGYPLFTKGVERGLGEVDGLSASNTTFAVVKGGALTIPNVGRGILENVDKTVARVENNGRFYILHKGADNKYYPVALRLKQYNKDQVNMFTRGINQEIDKFIQSGTQTSNDIMNLKAGLESFLYMPDGKVFFDVNDIQGSMTISRVKDDGTRITNTFQFRTNGITIGADVFANQLRNSIEKLELRYKPNIDNFNSGAANATFIDSDIFTTNYERVMPANPNIVANNLDSSGNEIQNEKKMSQFKKESPLNSFTKNEQEISYGGVNFVIDNDGIVYEDGVSVDAETQTLISDLNWIATKKAEIGVKNFDDTYTNKDVIVLPGERAINQKTGKYLDAVGTQKALEIVSTRYAAKRQANAAARALIAKIKKNNDVVHSRPSENAEGKYQILEDGKVENYDRVTTVIGSSFVERENPTEQQVKNLKMSQEYGTMVDVITRDFFLDQPVVKPEKMTESAFTSLMDTLREIKMAIATAGHKYLTDSNILHGKFVINGETKRVAGETDIIVVNGRGEAAIYDIKTSKQPISTYNKYHRTDHTRQLNSYANLFESQYDTKVRELKVLRFTLDYDENSLKSVKFEGPISIERGTMVNDIIPSNSKFSQETAKAPAKPVDTQGTMVQNKGAVTITDKGSRVDNKESSAKIGRFLDKAITLTKELFSDNNFQTIKSLPSPVMSHHLDNLLRNINVIYRELQSLGNTISDSQLELLNKIETAIAKVREAFPSVPVSVDSAGPFVQVETPKEEVESKVEDAIVSPEQKLVQEDVPAKTVEVVEPAVEAPQERVKKGRNINRTTSINPADRIKRSNARIELIEGKEEEDTSLPTRKEAVTPAEAEYQKEMDILKNVEFNEILPNYREIGSITQEDKFKIIRALSKISETSSTGEAQANWVNEKLSNSKEVFSTKRNRTYYNKGEHTKPMLAAAMEVFDVLKTLVEPRVITNIFTEISKDSSQESFDSLLGSKILSIIYGESKTSDDRVMKALANYEGNLPSLSGVPSSFSNNYFVSLSTVLKTKNGTYMENQSKDVIGRLLAKGHNPITFNQLSSDERQHELDCVK